MAESSAATSSVASTIKSLTAGEDRADRNLRADSSAWMKKITPTAGEQIPDATRDIPNAAEQVSNTSQLIDDAMAAQVSSDSSSSSSSANSTSKTAHHAKKNKGGNDLGIISTLLAGAGKKSANSRGRSTGSTLEKSVKDMKRLENQSTSTKIMSHTKDHELEK